MKISLLLGLLIVTNNSFAGEIYGLSQNVLKLISESQEIRTMSENMGIRTINFLNPNSLPDSGTYEIILSRRNSTESKCIYVSFDHLGSGHSEIVDVSKCSMW